MNTLFVNQMIQTAFIATFKKSWHNMILGQLKIGEHQATWRGLSVVMTASARWGSWLLVNVLVLPARVGGVMPSWSHFPLRPREISLACSCLHLQDDNNFCRHCCSPQGLVVAGLCDHNCFFARGKPTYSVPTLGPILGAAPRTSRNPCFRFYRSHARLSFSSEWSLSARREQISHNAQCTMQRRPFKTL